MSNPSPQTPNPVREFESEWADYRSALDEGDAAVFDELMDKMRAQSHAMAMQNPGDEDEPMALLLSVLLEQQREIMELQHRAAHNRTNDGMTVSQ